MPRRFLAACLAGMLCSQPSLADDDLAPLVEARYQVRAPALPVVRTRAQVEELARLLGSAEPAKRRAALAQAAGCFRPEIQAAIARCVKDPDPTVRRAAVVAALASEVRSAYPDVARFLASGFPGPFPQGLRCLPEAPLELRDPWGPVTTAFGLLGESAIPILAEQLRSSDETTRYVAINLLGQTRSPQAVAPLLPLLKDPSPKVRLRAFRALGVLGGPQALDAIAGATDESARRVAAVALAHHRDERAIDAWARLLREGKEEYAAAGIGHALRPYPLQRIVPILLEGMEHRQPHIRRECHDALKELTLQDFGFPDREEAGAADRQAALARWRQWWQANAGRSQAELLIDALAGDQARHWAASWSWATRELSRR